MLLAGWDMWTLSSHKCVCKPLANLPECLEWAESYCTQFIWWAVLSAQRQVVLKHWASKEIRSKPNHTLEAVICLRTCKALKTDVARSVGRQIILKGEKAISVESILLFVWYVWQQKWEMLNSKQLNLSTMTAQSCAYLLRGKPHLVQ